MPRQPPRLDRGDLRLGGKAREHERRQRLGEHEVDQAPTRRSRSAQAAPGSGLASMTAAS